MASEMILYSQKSKIYDRIFAVVKHLCSYYVLTTFHVLNLPRFAAFCLFCDKFNNLRAKFIVGKLRQIEAEYGILGGFSFMIKVLFVCHGNICRSPMAEFVLRDMVEKRGLGDCFVIASAATSREEIGNGVHPGTQRILRKLGISTRGKHAVQMTRADYDKYDFLLGMDQWNLKNMMRILGDDPEGKVKRLLDFSDSPRDIADPWYTGDFETTYRDVKEGCEAFLQFLADYDMMSQGTNGHNPDACIRTCAYESRQNMRK